MFTNMLLISISHEGNREISVSARSDALLALVIRPPQGKAYLGVLSFPRLDLNYALLQQLLCGNHLVL